MQCTGYGMHLCLTSTSRRALRGHITKHHVYMPDRCIRNAASSLLASWRKEPDVRTAIMLVCAACMQHGAQTCIKCKGVKCDICMTLNTLMSVGLSLPAQHVDDSWQSAEFFANKVASLLRR